MAAGSSTHRKSGPGKILDSKLVAATGSATDITFDEGACNLIMLENPGPVTVTKLKKGETEVFSLLPLSTWIVMPDFTKVNSCPENTHVGIAE